MFMNPSSRYVAGIREVEYRSTTLRPKPKPRYEYDIEPVLFLVTSGSRLLRECVLATVRMNQKLQRHRQLETGNKEHLKFAWRIPSLGLSRYSVRSRQVKDVATNLLISSAIHRPISLSVIIRCATSLTWRRSTEAHAVTIASQGGCIKRRADREGGNHYHCPR